MAFQLDVYFDKEDMQGLIADNPHGILISGISIPTTGTSAIPGPVLIALGISVNANGDPIRVILGCPTPCKPGGGGSLICKNDSVTLLNQLKAQFANTFSLLSLI